MRVSKIGGTFLGRPRNTDYSILGSVLGSTHFGKLPYTRFRLQRVELRAWGFLGFST